MYVYVFNAGIAINSGDWPVITELDDLIQELIENNTATYVKYDSDVNFATEIRDAIALDLVTECTDMCFIVHAEQLYDELILKADIVFKGAKIIKTDIPRYLSSVQIISGATGATINQCLDAMAYALDDGINNPLECAVQHIYDMREQNNE